MYRKYWCTCDIYEHALNYSHKIIFSNLLQGLTEELSKEGACERAIFPDTDLVITRCAIIGNLTVEGVNQLSSSKSDHPFHCFFPVCKFDGWNNIAG